MPASFSALTWNWTSVPSMTSVTLYLQSGPDVLPHLTQRVPSFSFFSREYLQGGRSGTDNLQHALHKDTFFLFITQQNQSLSNLHVKKMQHRAEQKKKT